MLLTEMETERIIIVVLLYNTAIAVVVLLLLRERISPLSRECIFSQCDGGGGGGFVSNGKTGSFG